MSRALAIMLMLGLPAIVAAQPAVPARPGVPPLPPIGLPLPQIGLPLPPIGLPLPPIGFPRAEAPQPHIPDHRPARRIRKQSAIYFVPVYGCPYLCDQLGAYDGAGVSKASAKRATPQPLTGRLRLDVEPRRDLQVYVDGYYVGTPDDLDSGLELPEGPHTVELRKDGYDALHLSVNVASGRSITYRETLKATETPVTAVPSATRAAPPPPSTHYIIPGCYIGNVLPLEAELPESCNPARMITITR